jgi:hypothetical protein
MAELRHFGSLPFVFMIGSLLGNQFAWRATDVGWVSRFGWGGTVKRPTSRNFQPS